MKTAAFLAILGVIFIAYGAACFVSPDLLEAMVGISASSTEGAAELRTMYGGVQMAVGMFYCLCACYKSHRPIGLLLHLVLFAVVAVSRLAAIVLDGASLSPFNVEASFNAKALFYFEIPVLLIGLWLYNQPKTAQATT